jgi:hypothetical protein
MEGRLAKVRTYHSSSQQAYLSGSGDTSNITIYLTTYEGGIISNNLYGLTWPTADGSVSIRFAYQPPFGYVFGHLSMLAFI